MIVLSFISLVNRKLNNHKP